MSNSDLKAALNNLIKQMEAGGNSKKDPVRNLLNAKTQGFIVNPRVILKEILRPESPFKIQLDTGIISGTSELRQVARVISDNLWIEFERFATQRFKTFRVAGNKLPGDFFDDSRITVALDSSKKIIYYRGKARSGKSIDNFTSFRDNFFKKVVTIIKTRTDHMDPTRVYVSPDQKYVDAMNIIDRQTNEAAPAGTSKEALQNRRRRARNSFLEDPANSGLTNSWRGLNLGHVYGSKVSASTGLLQDSSNVSRGDNFDNIKLAANLGELQPELLGVIKSIIRLDSEAVWVRVFKRNAATAELTLIIPESYVNNASSGGKVGIITKERLNPIVRWLAANLTKVEGSPNFERSLIEYIETLFLTGKVSPRKYTSRAKISKRLERNVNISNIPSQRVNITNTTRRNTRANQYNARGLLAIVLNPRLHDKIRENMGKGNSKTILNYRTGRFARSAKIKALTPSVDKRAIVATVAYRRNPYKIFEPKGRLNPPVGRDPARIFGRSIRQLLAELKIAQLRKVQVILRDK